MFLVKIASKGTSLSGAFDYVIDHRERRTVGKVLQKRSFLAVFSKIWSKTPSNKTVAMET